MKPEVPGCPRAKGSSGSFLSDVAWSLDPLGIVVSVLLDLCGVTSVTRAQRWQHAGHGFPRWGPEGKQKPCGVGPLAPPRTAGREELGAVLPSCAMAGGREGKAGGRGLSKCVFC